MTTVSYLTKTDLPDALKTGNLDLSAQNAIIQQLIKDGLYTAGPDHGRSVWVESDIFNGVQQPPLFDSPTGSDPNDPNPFALASVLEVEGAKVTVNTDAALKVIVDDGNASGTNTLTVTGGATPELIVLGNSNTKVTLLDHGSDTILAGDGNDTLLANDGDDSLVADSGNDSLVGGSGHDTLIGGSGHDTLQGGSGANYLFGGSGESTLTAGTGQHSWLQAGSGKTVITDQLSGGTDTLVAGSGADTITGQQGDWFTTNATMPATGNDVYNIHGSSGNSVIDLGSGKDTVNFYTTGGNDTVNYGGGHNGKTDTINFTTESLTNIAGVDAGAQSGDYLIEFKDGQSLVLNAHAQSQSKDAFVIEFSDGNTMHIKGGS
jgi:Ca2+-binding RTX toxin-like protein